MKRIIVIVLLSLATASICAQQTSYYKLVKIVKDGKHSNNVTGGQFITFSGNVCYESDNQGMSINSSRLEYNYSSNGNEVFVGTSYWGANSVFLFNADHSRLNVRTKDGSIYVYQRSTVPQGITTSSLIKKEQVTNSRLNQIYPSTLVVPIPTVKQKDSPTPSPPIPDPNIRHECPLCHGRKTIVHESRPPLFGMEDYLKFCNICNQSFMASSGHGHITCPQCHGKGYF